MRTQLICSTTLQWGLQKEYFEGISWWKGFFSFSSWADAQGNPFHQGIPLLELLVLVAVEDAQSSLHSHQHKLMVSLGTPCLPAGSPRKSFIVIQNDISWDINNFVWFFVYVLFIFMFTSHNFQFSYAHTLRDTEWYEKNWLTKIMYCRTWVWKNEPGMGLHICIERKTA